MKGIKHCGESQKRTAEMRAKMQNQKGFASGGRVHSFPDMDAGAAGGKGRLEKADKYGGNAKKK